MEPGTFWTAFIWGVLPALALLWALWSIDRYEKEPARLLVLALVFGAVLAPLAAYGLEKAFDLTTSLSSQVIVPEFQLGVGTPLVEELIRGAAILLVFLLVRWEIDDVLDGIVYGGIVGVGFGATANFVSIWSTPSLGDANASLFSSVVTSLNHVFYGALVGLVLALVRKERIPVIAGAAVAGTALAFGFHVLHDYLPWIAASSPNSLDGDFGREVLTQAPNYFGVFILGCIAIWAGSREKLIVSRMLRDEVPNVVTPADFAILTNGLRRWYILLTDMLWRGQRVWRLRRQLYSTEIELAFRKYHRGDREQSQSRQYVDEEDYRAQIADARAQLAKFLPEAETSTAGAVPGPSSTLVAGVGAAALFACVVAAGVLLWVFAFRTDAETTDPNVSPTPSGLSALAPAGAQPATEAPAPGGASLSAAKKVDVFICQSIRASRCVGRVNDKGSIPRQSAGFIVTIAYQNLKRGDEIIVGFFSAETRQPVANERRAKVVRPTGLFFIPFEGPFPRLHLVIPMLYNGGRVNKIWQFHLV